MTSEAEDKIRSLPDPALANLRAIPSLPRSYANLTKPQRKGTMDSDWTLPIFASYLIQLRHDIDKWSAPTAKTNTYSIYHLSGGLRVEIFVLRIMIIYHYHLR